MAKDQFKKNKSEDSSKQSKSKKVLHYFYYEKANGAMGLKSQYEDFVPVVVVK